MLWQKIYNGFPLFAFGYSKNFRLRFVIGTGAIINGQPMLYPMVLNNKGEWIGKIV